QDAQAKIRVALEGLSPGDVGNVQREKPSHTIRVERPQQVHRVDAVPPGIGSRSGHETEHPQPERGDDDQNPQSSRDLPGPQLAPPGDGEQTIADEDQQGQIRIKARRKKDDRPVGDAPPPETPIQGGKPDPDRENQHPLRGKGASTAIPMEATSRPAPTRRKARNEAM
ncbi:hypothetical protein KCV01_g19379, partial [Aureobasidium melanogenum]